MPCHLRQQRQLALHLTHSACTTDRKKQSVYAAAPKAFLVPLMLAVLLAVLVLVQVLVLLFLVLFLVLVLPHHRYQQGGKGWAEHHKHAVFQCCLVLAKTMAMAVAMTGYPQRRRQRRGRHGLPGTCPQGRVRALEPASLASYLGDGAQDRAARWRHTDDTTGRTGTGTCTCTCDTGTGTGIGIAKEEGADCVGAVAASPLAQQRKDACQRLGGPWRWRPTPTTATAATATAATATAATATAATAAAATAAAAAAFVLHLLPQPPRAPSTILQQRARATRARASGRGDWCWCWCWCYALSTGRERDGDIQRGFLRGWPASPASFVLQMTRNKRMGVETAAFSTKRIRAD